MNHGWSPELPDPSSWQPRDVSGQNLESAFLQRCVGVEKLLILRAQIERSMNVDNFDSGPGVEDIFRDELAKILPTRYSVSGGLVSNSSGLTAGDCDVVVFDHLWFPQIKAGATAASRRVHYPIEGVFGVIEVKQTLTPKALDEAAEKLVKVSRLADPAVDRLRIVENREIPALEVEPPPVYTAIVATGIDSHFEMEDAVHRFVAINGQLRRREVINALCVLGTGFATWGHRETGGEPARVSHFLGSDLRLPIAPVRIDSNTHTNLWELITSLLESFGLMAPGCESIASKYGASVQARLPTSSAWDLDPDAS